MSDIDLSYDEYCVRSQLYSSGDFCTDLSLQINFLPVNFHLQTIAFVRILMYCSHLRLKIDGRQKHEVCLL